MRGYYTWYTKISIAAAVLVISLQGVFEKLIINSALIPEDNKVLAIIIEIVVSLGVFAMVYQFAIWLYEKYIWKIVLKRINVTGKWYVEVQVDYGGGKVVSRYGEVNIDQSMGELTLTGYQFSKNNETEVKNTWTIWNSTFAMIDSKGTIQMKYNSQRCATDKSDEYAHPAKEGIVEMNVDCNEKGVPCTMKGSYTEYLPKFVKGFIRMRRTTYGIPKEYLEEINSLYLLPDEES
ncbi:hypothetical protein [Aristaeella lactis]|uniref:Uncharacterized protein n=1 Tax=Aristaeella lactis TaxID=3046383 RepID=A0AC61PLC9_9FIRM|nr:hypothetical protein [Aristaeella lactis]QUA52180.1 hypothetical protein JYE50_10685 [Aristaeella lactis]SMC58465.1 hypothetical protein SAMN06297397_1558 [Aristaeella lactis]